VCVCVCIRTYATINACAHVHAGMRTSE